MQNGHYAFDSRLLKFNELCLHFPSWDNTIQRYQLHCIAQFPPCLSGHSQPITEVILWWCRKKNIYWLEVKNQTLSRVEVAERMTHQNKSLSCGKLHRGNGPHSMNFIHLTASVFQSCCFECRRKASDEVMQSE